MFVERALPLSLRLKTRTPHGVDHAMRRFIQILHTNWLSWSGAILTTLSFMAFVTTQIYLSMYGAKHGPYAGIFAYVLIPALFLAGIMVIPLGLLIYRNQFQARMELLKDKPLRLVRLIAILTAVNLAVLGTAGHEAVQYMDTEQFCGVVCHTVMSPTYETHKDSPHAHVACVECHIGSGAVAFAKAKISGMRQLAAILFDTYERPIPAPMRGHFELSESCHDCHWPERQLHDKLVVRTHYADDDAVTPATNVLMMKIGGATLGGARSGIHWHANPDIKITFASPDGKRNKVSWVQYIDAKGKERIFTTEDVDAKAPPQGELRKMDCVDCHNQPSHNFQDPGAAVDAAIAAGSISRSLPAIRKNALATLRKTWSRDTATDAIKKDLEQTYAGASLAEEARAQLAPASEAIAKIWMRNIYPEMKITWGTYPNFLGHNGCMRCHDGEHMDQSGEAITADCAKCHTVVAEKVAAPPILKDLGLQKK